MFKCGYVSRKVDNNNIHLKTLQQQGQIKRNNCTKINYVHWTLYELHLSRTASQSDEILKGEECHSDDVDDVDDLEEKGVLHLALLVVLKLVNRREDERKG